MSTAFASFPEDGGPGVPHDRSHRCEDQATPGATPSAREDRRRVAANRVQPTVSDAHPSKSSKKGRARESSLASPSGLAASSDSDTLDASRTDLAGCQKRIAYQFSDTRLLEAALTHASGVQHRLASNERMEFLGDAILGMVVCEKLFELYPEYSEGELTKIKSCVVSRDTCAKLSDQLELRNYLILGKGMASDPEVPRSVMAAGFESLVAAVYLDGGMAPVRQFILTLVLPEIESAVATEFGGNYKSLLQQLAQREHGVTPTYQLLDEKGPDHSKCFQIAAQVGDLQFPPAWGKSKKESEQRAAHNAISCLRGEEAPFASDASTDASTDESTPNK